MFEQKRAGELNQCRARLGDGSCAAVFIVFRCCACGSISNEKPERSGTGPPDSQPKIKIEINKLNFKVRVSKSE